MKRRIAKVVAAAIIVGVTASIGSTVLGEVTKPAIIKQEDVCISDGVSRNVLYLSNGESKPNGIRANYECEGYKPDN